MSVRITALALLTLFHTLLDRSERLFVSVYIGGDGTALLYIQQTQRAAQYVEHYTRHLYVKGVAGGNIHVVHVYSQ